MERSTIPNDCAPGHATIECKDNHVFDMSEVPDMGPEDAWAAIRSADAEEDLDDLKAVSSLCELMRRKLTKTKALKVYCKAVPVTTYDELERAFRTNKFNTHLIAQVCLRRTNLGGEDNITDCNNRKKRLVLPLH